jgi:hypothetical protein
VKALENSIKMLYPRKYLVLKISRNVEFSPVSEFEDMDDIVDVDDSDIDLLLWISSTWSERSSNLRRRYLKYKYF